MRTAHALRQRPLSIGGRSSPGRRTWHGHGAATCVIRVSRTALTARQGWCDRTTREALVPCDGVRASVVAFCHRPHGAAAIRPRRPCGAVTGGEGSSAGRAPGCGPGGRGFESRPSPQPRDAPAGAERRPSTLTTDAGVAELVDALDLGSGELCSWRFKSSHPHQQLSLDPRTDHTAVRSASAAHCGPFQRQTENPQ